MSQRLACLVGICGDKTPLILGQLRSVTARAVPGLADAYRIRLDRGAHRLDALGLLAHPDSGPATALGLPGFLSAAPDNRWRVWWLLAIGDDTREHGPAIYRALNRLSRDALNVNAQGEHHITRPWTCARALALWAPAAAALLLHPETSVPQIPVIAGDPPAEVQKGWDYDPDDGTCDSDQDLGEEMLDAIFAA